MKEITVKVNFLKHFLGQKYMNVMLLFLREATLVFFYSVKSHKLLSFTYFTMIRKSSLYLCV